MSDAFDYERDDASTSRRRWSVTAIIGFLLGVAGPSPTLIIENSGAHVGRIYLLFIPLAIGLASSLFATLRLCTTRVPRKHGFVLAIIGAVAGSAWLSLYLHLMRL